MARRGRYAQPLIYEYEGMTPIYREKRQLPRWLSQLMPVIVMLLIVLAVCLWGVTLKFNGIIYPNVRVAGVDVSGLTAEEARVLVEDRVTEIYQTQVLKVDLPDRQLVFDPQQLDVKVDAEKAVEAALAYGRDGNIFKAVTRYLMGLSVIRAVRLENALTLNTDYLKEMIDETVKDITKEPVNTSATIDADMTRITLKIGTVGRSMDGDRLLEEVIRSYQRGEFYPIEWNYKTVDYQQVDLSALYRKLRGMAANARYDAERKVVIRSSTGYHFALKDAIKRQNIAEDGTILEIPLEVLKPTVTYGKLTYQMFGQRLAEVSTSYTFEAGRNKNMRTACETINGLILNPGDVFSFNEVIGECTEEKGYGYISYGIHGERTDILGEGISQVASTMYYAALYADLTTVERTPHTYRVEYTPAGCDAYVSWEDGVDYQFRNNRENPIKIQAKMEEGKCIVAFWGVTENDSYVTLSEPEILETWTEADVEQYDATRPAGFRMLVQTGYDGYKVEVVKQVHGGTGKLLREETLQTLYQSRPAIYIVGSN